MPLTVTGPGPAAPRGAPPAQGGGYAVKSGDTLGSIARDHGVGLPDLIRANPQVRDPDRITPGQRVAIPAAPAGTAEGERTHKLQRGESLGNLAKAHGLALDDVMRANPHLRDPKRVRAGTLVHLPPPGGSPETVAPPRSREDRPPLTGGVDRRTLEAGLRTTAADPQPSAARPDQPVSPADLPTTGASARTAAQDRAPAGVEGSRQMAATDERRVARYQEDFRDAGARHGIDPAFLAAIASRESRGGNVLDANGCGDGGNGFGLMQVDRRYHQTQGGPFSREHINQAAGILAGFRDDLAARHPDWTRDQVMTASLSAYNRGTRNMDDPGNTDRGTTGGDYANDVIARAQYYKERGF